MIDFRLTDYADWFEHLIETLRTELPEEARQFVRRSYADRSRVYHGTFHVAFLWYCHNVLNPERLEHTNHSLDGTRAALAIACHDVIYDPRSHTNEADSAAWCRNKAVNTENGDWAAEVIKATADHFAPREMRTEDDFAREWIIGIDLIPLAAPWEVFHMDGFRIRAEYWHHDDAAFKAGRQAFLSKVNSSTAIYQHPVLHAMFEQAARENIKRFLLL